MDKTKQKYLLEKVNKIVYSQQYENAPVIVESDYIKGIRKELAEYDASINKARRNRTKAIDEAKTKLLDTIYFKEEAEVLKALEEFTSTTFGY